MIGIEQIEEVRRKLRISRSVMAKVLGVSRVSYYNWEKDGTMIRTKRDQVSDRLKLLVKVCSEHQFPKPEDMMGTAKTRGNTLLELIAQHE